VQTLAQIRELLAARGLSPKRALGQNFLIDHNLIRKLVDASGVRAGDTVLEVGPGTGALTEELLDRGCVVVACELDDQLADLLRDRHAANPRFTLIHGDCLAGKRAVNPELLAGLGAGPFTLVANLPYGAATPLILALLTAHPRCKGLWVTVQREVADRLLALPGTEAYGTISVVADAASLRTRVARLPPECFWPRPDVESAMAGLERRGVPLAPDLPALADFTQFLFGKRRKQLAATLGSALAAAVRWPRGIDPKARAENLGTAQFVALLEAVRACPAPELSREIPGAGNTSGLPGETPIG
jgi:16S rRNA (adenine1518-N6/adenine1519-N6)-dimethyltransferase